MLSWWLPFCAAAVPPQRSTATHRPLGKNFRAKLPLPLRVHLLTTCVGDPIHITPLRQRENRLHAQRKRSWGAHARRRRDAFASSTSRAVCGGDGTCVAPPFARASGRGRRTSA